MWHPKAVHLHKHTGPGHMFLPASSVAFTLKSYRQSLSKKGLPFTLRTPHVVFIVPFHFVFPDADFLCMTREIQR